MDLLASYYSVNALTKVNLDTFTRVDAIDLTPGGGGNFAVGAITIEDYLYVGRDVFPGQIVKIDLENFAEVARLNLAEVAVGAAVPHCFAYKDNILYVAIDRPVGGILSGVVRVNIPTFTRIDRLNLNARWATAPIISGNYLYVPHSTAAGELRRITLAPFALDATINLTNPNALCTTIVGNNLYVGHSVTPAVITRVNLTTFTETGAITFPVGENWCWSIVSDGIYLYCGLATAPGNPGIIVRVNLTTFTRVDSLTLPLTEPDVWNLFIYGEKLYALLESAPARVVRIDIPTFTREDVIVFPAAEFDSWAGALWTPTVTPEPIQEGLDFVLLPETIAQASMEAK